MDLVAASSRLRQGTSGSITGPIHFVVGERCFPDESWDDFPVVVLGWWLSAVGQLSSGQSRSEELEFMDGPFSVQCVLRVDGIVDVRCYAHRAESTVEAVAEVTLQGLLDMISQASLTALEACERNGWSDDKPDGRTEIPELAEALRRVGAR